MLHFLFHHFAYLLRRMNVIFLISMIAGCGIMMALETWGLPTTLALSFKGDIKRRESRRPAQYGQFVWHAGSRHC